MSSVCFGMNLIFDTHAHYDSESFEEDREQLLSSLPDRGVCGMINAGADLAGSRASLEIAGRYSWIYAAVGIHPEECGDLPENWEEQIREMSTAPKVVAIGEIGLDYHFEDMAPRDVQKRVFEQQILLAKERGLPVIIHDRDAHGDTMELLRKHRPRGVLHCFSGSVEMMREVMALGMYIGLGGVVTFKNARVPVEVAREVPLDRLLLETDAPYMAPVPFRGKRCDSAMIAYSAARIAEIRGIPSQELLAQTKANAERFFGLEEVK